MQFYNFTKDKNNKDVKELDRKTIDCLINIQDQLERLWPLLEFYISKTKLNNYSAPVVEASGVVEIMITLLAYEHGYTYDGLQFKKIGTNDCEQLKHITPITFLRRGNLEDIPQEIIKFLTTIQQMRNQAVHRYMISYGEAVCFADAFDCFVSWFVVNSSTLKDTENPSVAKFLSRIDSFKSRMTLKIITEDAESKEYVVSTMITQAKQAVENKADSIDVNASILSKMDKILSMNESVVSGISRIEKKIDKIAEKIDELSEKIGDYQSLLTKQIDKAISEDEIDRIISSYADECTNRIVREVNSSIAGQEYSSEEEKLIISLGESAWNKLDSMSKNFLITAKITYNKLIAMHDVIDYSGVCLLVTKAIEVEMSNRFCRDFLSYLKENYPGKSNYTQFPTTLLNKYGKPIKTKDFTLGSLAYVLCYCHSDGLTVEKIENNHTKLMEFVSRKLMVNQAKDTIDAKLEWIAESVENIRKDYRNPSAHTNQLQYVDAKQCFDLVLDIEKLLKGILDSMDY